MKTDRLIALLMVMLSRRRVGAGELAEQFQVSVRTIYRDIEALSLAGVPVVSTSGAGGGFHLMEGFKLDHRLLTQSDISALMQGVSSLTPLLGEHEQRHLQARLQSLLPETELMALQQTLPAVRFDHLPWGKQETGLQRLRLLRESIAERLQIVFDYLDRNGQTSTREVEPHQLVLKSGIWYLVGYCQLRQAFRLFKVERLDKLTQRETTFIPRPVPEDMPDFQMDCEAQLMIRLRIHRSLRERLLTFCELSDMTPCGADCYEVWIPFITEDCAYHWVIGLGPQCECLEPESVRARLREYLQHMINLYQ